MANTITVITLNILLFSVELLSWSGATNAIRPHSEAYQKEITSEPSDFGFTIRGRFSNYVSEIEGNRQKS